MCNRYTPPSAERLAADFELSTEHYQPREVFPRGPGYFVRSQHGVLTLVQGQWGLIPWFAKSPSLPYSTNNARSEELEHKASYKQPWARGQRCLIPVALFWEPCWESGRNHWWRFKRADGHAFALAGLWNSWHDPHSGTLHESYTMLTLNADTHPLMSRMHKPDPKLAPEAQDKRMVCVLERAAWIHWLSGTLSQARACLAPADVAVFESSPESAQQGEIF